MNDFYHDRQITARTHHLCANCNWLIPPGAKYWGATGKSDDHFFTMKLCSDCHDLVDVALELCQPDYGLMPIDQLFSELWDCGVLITTRRWSPPSVAEKYQDKLQVVTRGKYWRVRVKGCPQH